MSLAACHHGRRGRCVQHLQAEIEEDMVLASEPASDRSGLGTRREDVVAIRGRDTDLLTDREHRL